MGGAKTFEMKDFKMSAYVSTKIEQDNDTYYDSKTHESVPITHGLPAFNSICVLSYIISKLDKSAPDFADKQRDVANDFIEHIRAGGRAIDACRDEPSGLPLHAAYILGVSPATIEYHLGLLDVNGPKFRAWVASEFAHGRG